MVLSNAEAVDQIGSGQMLPKPEECPEEMDDIRRQGWSKNPVERPTFEKLLEMISEINDKYNRVQEKEKEPEEEPDDKKDGQDEPIYNTREYV